RFLYARGWQEKQFATKIVVDGAEQDSPTHCVFHAKPVTRSTASRSLIPRQAGHRFHGKPVGG
ncbi:MAG: hypothetical protein LW835_16555, partial [Burkholderiaceae bacterium]|nr:hypothetical protein [Burkholderiaceae bacterium]